MWESQDDEMVQREWRIASSSAFFCKGRRLPPCHSRITNPSIKRRQPTEILHCLHGKWHSSPFLDHSFATSNLLTPPSRYAPSFYSEYTLILFARSGTLVSSIQERCDWNQIL